MSPAACLALFWAMAAAVCFASLPAAYEHSRSLTEAAEPYHVSPLGGSPTTLTLRHDEIGKGFFGASRGGGKRRHKGLDLVSPVGAPVVATKSGRVRVAAVDRGYGNWVELLHPDGLSTRYAHLSAVSVRAGDWVRRGDVIGRSGKSGNADDPAIVPHLHYEIRWREHALNPADKLFDPRIRLQ